MMKCEPCRVATSRKSRLPAGLRPIPAFSSWSIPTRGVDVGARREIKRIWLDLSAKGQAILLASTDAEELVDACDRVIVMSHGHQVGELSGLELTERNLLRMATDV